MELITYISLFRGINVGGHKKIKMSDLKHLFESLNFSNVTTYLQSGNVVFKSKESNGHLIALHIETEFTKYFGFTTSVLLRSSDELKQIIGKNPFIQDKGIEYDSLYVTFLYRAPNNQGVINSGDMSSGLDKYILLNGEVYLNCPQGYGRTRFSNNFFEKKLEVKATTRNWKTVIALSSIAEE